MPRTGLRHGTGEDCGPYAVRNLPQSGIPQRRAVPHPL